MNLCIPHPSFPPTYLSFMKKLYLILIFLLPVLAQAQWLNFMTISPTPTLECSTTVVTLDGTQGCINGVFNGTTLNITGNVITVSLDETLGPICLPALANINGSVNLTGLTAGTYTVIGQYVQNGNIMATLTQTLVVGSCCSVNPGITNPVTSICIGDSITFAAADPSLTSINWKVDGNSIGTSASITETFATAGTYTISMVGDDGSCVDSSSQTITVVDFPAISFPTTIDEGCPGKLNGSINSSVTLGSGNFTYSWSNGATSPNISGLAAGTYVLTVTDNAGCSSVDSAAISAGPAVFASFTPSDSLVCAGDTIIFNNTSIGNQASLWYLNGVLSSATPTYQSSLFSPGANQIKLVASTATCEDSAFQTITVSEKPSVQAALTNPTCPAASDGSIALTLTPWFPPYTFLWPDGSSANTLSGLVAGDYIVQITDSVGCAYLDTVTVVADSGIVASFMASDSGLVCLGSSITLTNTTQGSPTIDWLVNGSSIGGGMTQSYTFSDTGAFVISMQVTDGVCEDTSDVMLTVPSLPSSMISASDEVCPGSANGAVVLAMTGGIQPYNFSWSNGETTGDLSGLMPGTYVLTVTDDIGCESKDTATIGSVGGIDATYAYFYGPTGIKFDPMATNGVAWAWDFGDGTTSTDSVPIHQYQFNGTYDVCLTITDGFGCVDSSCKRVDFATSIQDQLDGQISFSPNPTHSLVIADFSAWAGKTVSISLIDMLGRTVSTGEVIAGPSVEIDLSQHANGMYTIIAEINGRYFTGKVMKE